jgi:hypothetical protein
MRILLTVLLVLTLAGNCFAQMGFSSSAAAVGASIISQKMTNGVGVGMVQSGGESVAVLGWRPDFKTGPFGLGLDVNIPLGDKRPADFESVVVRYAEYDTGKWGVRYGILDSVTYGSGLLVRNYTTQAKGGALLSNKQVGLKGYVDGALFGYDIVRLDMMGTWSNLYVVRLTEKVMPRLILGQTYVTDSDGVTFIDENSVTQTYAAQSAYGIDAIVPLFKGAQLYAEYAALTNYGSGFNTGLGMGYDLSSMISFDFKAEWRSLQSNFIPGYFDNVYETNPKNLASYNGTEKTGYLVSLGVVSNIPQGKFTLAGKLEDYANEKASIGATLAGQFDQYEVAGSYEQPNFDSTRSVAFEDGGIITGTVAYKINPFTKMVGKYKKAYNPDAGEVQESMVYEVALIF